ncbi:MAG: YtxH domain-containing protein [Fimbriimonadaceae bacterium]|nr:YtxH domain-containing protein [Chthonomonadaceae bacterium]MCO5298013.1 YtxH domain-containing protein [Fimbriimonadaceae bacterium]
MNDSDEKNALIYMLAGVGLGAIIGAAAGLLFAPKAGPETREELASKLKELKAKTEDWIAEQRAKKHAGEPAEEVGA